MGPPGSASKTTGFIAAAVDFCPDLKYYKKDKSQFSLKCANGEALFQRDASLNREEGRKTIWKKLAVIAFLFVVTAGALRAEAVSAAALQNVPGEGSSVRIGSYYYRIRYKSDSSGANFVLLQRGKNKTGSYATVCKAQPYSGYVTDGETVYYLTEDGSQKRSLWRCVIKTKKYTKLKSFTMKSPYGIQLEGGFEENLYIMSKTTPIAVYRLWSYNTASEKWTTLLKNSLLWAYGPSRYMMYSKSQKGLKGDRTAAAAGPIYVLDKITGKTKVAVKRGTICVQLPVAAFEDTSQELKNCQVAAVPSSSGKTWSIQKYTFSTGKLKKLKTLQNVKSVGYIFMSGNSVSVGYVTTSGKSKDISIRF